jgi:hypothetical protein
MLGDTTCESQCKYYVFSCIIRLRRYLLVGLDSLSVDQVNDNSGSPSDRQLSFEMQSASDLDGHIYLPLPSSSGISHLSVAPEVAIASPIPSADSNLLMESFNPVDPLALLSPQLEMMWPNWPPSLPSPDLLRHLCVSRAYRLNLDS